MSMGCGLGVPLLAAEPRIRAALLVLLDVHGSAEIAARVTAPVPFLLQRDDALVPRAQGLALFDALASAEKTLHANPGKQILGFETDSSLRFFTRHLGRSRGCEVGDAPDGLRSRPARSRQPGQHGRAGAGVEDPR
jgi:hypothetical protein